MYPKPFDKYPQEWYQEPPPPRTGSNCHDGYCLELHKRTGQSTCAYCGLSFIDEYEHWLLMAVDHVVPTGANKIGIPKEYLGSWANCVLACCVCNLFKNRSIDLIKPPGLAKWQDLSWQEFLALRDDTFLKRKSAIKKDNPHKKERECYLSKWKNPPCGA